MIRNLKPLVLGLMVVSAISAGWPATASAEFTTTSGATLTGTQAATHKFTVTGQTVTCSSFISHGVAPAAPFEAVTMSPRYTSCKNQLGTNATFTGFGHLAAEAGKSKCGFVIRTSGASQLECESGAEVILDVGPCIVHFPSQPFGAGITYQNKPGSGGNADDIMYEFDITGVTANHTDGFLCPFGSSGHNAEAVFEGATTVIAELPNGNQVDLTHDQ